jgi:rubrerythrin
MDKAAPIIDAGVSAVQKNILSNPSTPMNPNSSESVKLSCVTCGTQIPIIGDPAAVDCPKCGLTHKKNILK